MNLVFSLEGQEGCKFATNISYGFDCTKLFFGLKKTGLVHIKTRLCLQSHQ